MEDYFAEVGVIALTLSKPLAVGDRIRIQVLSAPEGYSVALFAVASVPPPGAAVNVIAIVPL